MRSLVYLHVKAMFVYRGRVFRALLVVGGGGLGWPKSGRGWEQPDLGFGNGWAQGTSLLPRGSRPALHCVPIPAMQDQVSFLCSPPLFLFFAVFIVRDSSLGRDNEKQVGVRGLLPACGALKRKETSCCLSCGVTAIVQRESNAVQNPLSKIHADAALWLLTLKHFAFASVLPRRA